MHRGVWEIRELSCRRFYRRKSGRLDRRLIGDNNHGWRGGYRGSAIGNIVGTIAGAAIGNALTAPKPDPIEEYAYVPEVRQGQSHSKFKPRTQTQQQLTQLKLRKIRFIDDNRNHAIDGGESSKIIFES